MTEDQRQDDPADDVPPDIAAVDMDVDADAPTLEEALQQIAVLDKKLAEATDKMLRALAETENTRRRLERERQDTAKFAVSNFAREMLTVSDNLRRALNAVPAGESEKNEQIKTIYTGVEATERDLLRVFEKNNIKKIDPLNQKFDPNLHEVIFEIPSDRNPGTVLQVVEPGYMIHDRLLRPARVGVAKSNDAPPEGSKIDQQV